MRPDVHRDAAADQREGSRTAGASRRAAGVPPRAGGAIRLVAVAGAALGLFALAAAAIVYAFGVKEWGYFFFDVSDIPVYFEYAASLARGARPYVDFPVEYPPLALSLFTLPGAQGELGPYAVRFALQMGVFGALAAVACSAAAARVWPAGWRPYAVAATFALAVAATGALLANRFDAAVALVLAVTLLLLVERWHSAAAFALGLGFALKLVPAILLPLVLVLAASPRAALRAAVAFAVAAAAPFLPHLPEGLGALSQVFAYHGARPLQVESVLATPFWIGRLAGLADVTVGNGFGSQYVVARGAEATAHVSGILGLGMLALAYAGIWRARAPIRERIELVPLAAAAVVIAFVTFGKVLSPQFLIWLLPFVALLAPAHRVLASLLLAAMVLTQVEFPANYWRFVGGDAAAIACVVARNVLLLGAFVASVAALWRSRDAYAE